MRDDEPPLLPASPAPGPATPGRRPSRFKRALYSLRSSFRSSSPFHFASLKRSGSAKSSVSDSEIVRGERTMRRKNKKQRADSANAASRSTDSSPTTSKKKTGLLKRMSTIGKRRVDSSTPSSTDVDPMDPEMDADRDSDLESDSKLDETPILEMSLEPEKQEVASADYVEQNPTTSLPESPVPESTVPELSVPESSVPESLVPESPVPETTVPESSVPESSIPESASPEPPFIAIAVDHPVAMRCFTKEAWKRRSKTEIQKPIEESGPGNATKRRIAFVAQTSGAMSEDRDDDDDDDDEDVEEDGGEVGSLEEAVALARQRLAQAHSAPPQSSENNEPEEEGCADMPAYGDLLEPEHKADTDDEPVSVRCAVIAQCAQAVRAMRARHDLRGERS
ncbi:nucleolin-like [Bicyclus anynana]|uniref:Nucleolin-like n=1 Tax=Bicyclus anynana TaxID=110368 RepID=A0ABM3LEW8_BICAN|nr:nucleolin-like [Bicyclus anynana]